MARKAASLENPPTKSYATKSPGQVLAEQRLAAERERAAKAAAAAKPAVVPVATKTAVAGAGHPDFGAVLSRRGRAVIDRRPDDQVRQDRHIHHAG